MKEYTIVVIVEFCIQAHTTEEARRRAKRMEGWIRLHPPSSALTWLGETEPHSIDTDVWET